MEAHQSKPVGMQLVPAVAAALRDSGYGVVVTGAGGWLGQAALEMLDAALGDTSRTRLIAFSRSPQTLELRSGRTLRARALGGMATELASQPPRPWMFFHFAFLTRDKVSGQPLDDYVQKNRQITETLLSALQFVKAAGIFTPSSGAVYRKDGTLETDLAANPYGLLKLEDEKLFSNAAHLAQCSVVIPRLFNLAGPFINKVEHYALASLILAAQRGGPMTIRAPHRVVRSYVHVADLINLATAVLLKHRRWEKEIFDTAGEREVELSELAGCIRDVLGTPVAIERPPIDESAERADVYVGDGTKLRELAAKYAIPLQSLPQQIADTAAYLNPSGPPATFDRAASAAGSLRE